jgi:hypothetical protein
MSKSERRHHQLCRDERANVEKAPPRQFRAMRPVVAGQYLGALTESRTYTGKRVAIPDDKIEFAAYQPMGNRHARCTGRWSYGRGRG